MAPPSSESGAAGEQPLDASAGSGDEADGGGQSKTSAKTEKQPAEFVSGDFQLHVRQISADGVSAVHALLKQYHP